MKLGIRRRSPRLYLVERSKGELDERYDFDHER